MANLKAVPRPLDSDAPAAKRAYKAGDVIAGKYTLVEEIGEGGMGVVWVGHNTVLDVPVAVKLMSIGTQADSLLRERLLQEARAAARIAHPAICRTLDYGTTDYGAPFVVMELLRGETLASTLGPNVRIPAPRAVQLLLPIINGLGVAHALGIVHRDVKPENVFLHRDEFGRLQPKLLDFGIARFVKYDSKLTLEGSALGTPDYMSPEQARGDVDVDFRTDVWSVSVVLYEMITGRIPFAADNYNKLMWAIQNQAPVPTVDLAAGDGALWTVLERGLAKNRLERWASMHELGEALALWLYEQGVREDACGASLRSTWLEAGLSGVKVEVSSVAPPPSPSAGKVTLPPNTKQPVVIERPAPEFDDTQTGEFSRKSRSTRAAWLAALVLGLGALGFFVVRYARTLPSSPFAAPAAQATTEAETSEPAPLPPPTPEPTAERAEPAPEAEPIPSASVQALEVEPTPKAASEPPKPRPVTTKPRRPASKTAAPPKAKDPNMVDFGF